MESTTDGDTQAKTNMMVDIPHTAIGRRNKKNKKNSGHNRNNSKGNDNQRGKGKKGKRHQYRNQNRDHNKIFGNDDEELEAMSQWQQSMFMYCLLSYQNPSVFWKWYHD